GVETNWTAHLFSGHIHEDCCHVAGNTATNNKLGSCLHSTVCSTLHFLSAGNNPSTPRSHTMVREYTTAFLPMAVDAESPFHGRQRSRTAGTFPKVDRPPISPRSTSGQFSAGNTMPTRQPYYRGCEPEIRLHQTKTEDSISVTKQAREYIERLL